MKPIRYRITHKFPDIQISEKNLAKLLEIVSWQQVPSFPCKGRTAWHVFEDNELSAKPKFRAAKLKGVGVWNPRNSRLYSSMQSNSFLDEPQPPQTQEYEAVTKLRHIGFTKEAEYIEVYSQAAPFGGIAHSRAIQEYHNAQKLWEKNVPAIAPFMVIQYPDYEFQGELLSAVISLFPEIYPYRLEMLLHPYECLEPEERKFCVRVRESLGLSGSFNDETERLKSIAILGRKVGKLLHDLSKAGLYRHSGGWGNIQYCIEQGQPFLTDLDSTLNLHELPKIVQPLQILRDLASALRWFLDRFYRPMFLETYTLTNLLNYDPLAEIIGGYFIDVPPAEIQQVTKKLWGFFIPFLFLCKRNRQELANPAPGNWNNNELMDTKLFYALAITSLYPMYLKSDLAVLYPASFTVEEVKQKAQAFLGDNYDYFLYLLDDGNLDRLIRKQEKASVAA